MTVEIHPTIKEWLFEREVMRRLGFTPDEIKFEAYESGKVTGSVEQDFGMPVIGVLVQRGERVFRWLTGPVPMTPIELRAAYDVAVKAWNDGAVDPDGTGFEQSCARRDVVQVATALMAKGFKFSDEGTVLP